MGIVSESRGAEPTGCLEIIGRLCEYTGTLVIKQMNHYSWASKDHGGSVVQCVRLESSGSFRDSPEALCCVLEQNTLFSRESSGSVVECLTRD